jgi:hypothetical protein
VKWTTPAGKKLTIKNPNGKRNLEAIKVNNSKIDGYFIPYDLFKNGGVIEVLTQ